MNYAVNINIRNDRLINNIFFYIEYVKVAFNFPGGTVGRLTGKAGPMEKEFELKIGEIFVRERQEILWFSKVERGPSRPPPAMFWASSSARPTIFVSRP